MNAQILNISYDAVLLQTRAAILRAAGYSVMAAGSFAQAVALSQQCAFDLVIIGHSLPPVDVHLLVAAAHATDTPVMLMTRGAEQPCAAADLIVRAADGPWAFVRAVKELVNDFGTVYQHRHVNIAGIHP